MGATLTFRAQPLSKDDIEAKVTRFLAVHHPEHLSAPGILDMERVLTYTAQEAFGFAFEMWHDSEFPSHGEAFTDFDRDKLIMSEKGYLALCNNDPRARFTVAHEVGGHLVLHLDQIRSMTSERRSLIFARSAKEQPDKVYNNPEWQAEHAGGVLLMPAATLKPFIAKLASSGCAANELVEECQYAYGVSYAAGVSRLKKIGVRMDP